MRQENECDCVDWKTNMCCIAEPLDGLMLWDEFNFEPYGITPFRYCPWCGRKL